MKKLYLFALLGISAATNAQRFDWVKFVAPVNNTAIVGSARDVVADSSGNLYTFSLFDQPIVVGDETVTPTVANQNMILVKWDADGNVLAYKRLQCGGGGFTLHQLTFDEPNDDILVAFDISAGGPINIEDETVANGDNTVSHIFRFESDLTFKSDLPHLYTYSMPLTVKGDFLYYAHGYQSVIYKRDSENSVVWSVTPSAGALSIYGMTVDDDGNVYVVGRAGGVFSEQLVTMGGVTVTFGPSNTDQLVMFKIGPDGNVLEGSYITRGTPFGTATPVTTDADGNIYVFATYNTPELSIGSLDLENPVGANDAFVVKYDAMLEPQWVQPLHNSSGNMYSEDMFYDNGSLLVSGSFGGDATFGTTEFSSGPYGTGFFSRLDAADGSVDFGVPVGSITGTGRAMGAVKVADAYFVAGGSFAAGENGGTYGCYTETKGGAFLTRITDVPFTAPQIELTYENGYLTSAATTDAITYEWYLGSDLIEDATGTAYIPTETGTYTVVATFGFGCSDSATVTVTELGLAEIGQNQISIYPNPVKDKLFLNFDSAEISLYDLTGKKISAFAPNGREIDLSGVERGVYLLRTDSATFRIIKF